MYPVYTISFARGITPATHTVVQQIDNVANNPIMMFIVVKVMIGNANVTPIIIPMSIRGLVSVS
jgi:hypothetical protein